MPGQIALISEPPTFEIVRGIVHIHYPSGRVDAMHPHDLMVGIERAKRAVVEWQASAVEPVRLGREHLRGQSARGLD